MVLTLLMMAQQNGEMEQGWLLGDGEDHKDGTSLLQIKPGVVANNPGIQCLRRITLLGIQLSEGSLEEKAAEYKLCADVVEVCQDPDALSQTSFHNHPDGTLSSFRQFPWMHTHSHGGQSDFLAWQAMKQMYSMFPIAIRAGPELPRFRLAFSSSMHAILWEQKTNPEYKPPCYSFENAEQMHIQIKSDIDLFDSTRRATESSKNPMTWNTNCSRTTPRTCGCSWNTCSLWTT